jgi:hypothetical protein
MATHQQTTSQHWRLLAMASPCPSNSRDVKELEKDVKVNRLSAVVAMPAVVTAWGWRNGRRLKARARASNSRLSKLLHGRSDVFPFRHKVRTRPVGGPVVGQEFVIGSIQRPLRMTAIGNGLHVTPVTKTASGSSACNLI